MRMTCFRRAVGALLPWLALVSTAGAQEKPERLAIPTVRHGRAMWVAATEASDLLGFRLSYQDHSLVATREDGQATARPERGSLWINPESRAFVPVQWLTTLGYGVRWDPQANHAVVTWEGRTGVLAFEPKSIAVDLRRQVLTAREGDVVVYRFRTSTGRRGHATPDGNYQVRRKERLHISSLYPEPNGGAKMPYSLWFTSAYYIHGYHSVPHHPASHGCIRIRVAQAKQLYDWASVGTPVRVYRTEVE